MASLAAALLTIATFVIDFASHMKRFGMSASEAHGWSKASTACLVVAAIVFLLEAGKTRGS